jgi:hypothetical protein
LIVSWNAVTVTTSDRVLDADAVVAPSPMTAKAAAVATRALVVVFMMNLLDPQRISLMVQGCLAVDHSAVLRPAGPTADVRPSVRSTSGWG